MTDDKPAWMTHREMLIACLVGVHGHLYMTSASFKHAIDMLAVSYIPAMVDGLAAAAEKEDHALYLMRVSALGPPGDIDG